MQSILIKRTIRKKINLVFLKSNLKLLFSVQIYFCSLAILTSNIKSSRPFICGPLVLVCGFLCFFFGCSRRFSWLYIAVHRFSLLYIAVCCCISLYKAVYRLTKPAQLSLVQNLNADEVNSLKRCIAMYNDIQRYRAKYSDIERSIAIQSEVQRYRAKYSDVQLRGRGEKLLKGLIIAIYKNKICLKFNRE